MGLADSRHGIYIQSRLYFLRSSLFSKNQSKKGVIACAWHGCNAAATTRLLIHRNNHESFPISFPCCHLAHLCGFHFDRNAGGISHTCQCTGNKRQLQSSCPSVCYYTCWLINGALRPNGSNRASQKAYGSGGLQSRR